MAPAQAHVSWHIGLVGFSYPEWTKTFYTSAPRSIHRLSTYSRTFNAVEINTTFYGTPSASTVTTWNDATPSGFRFCIKMPRDVTHGPTPLGMLAATDGPPSGHLLEGKTLAEAQRFIEVVQPLDRKLGFVLLQFPSRFTVARRDELANFLDRLGRAMPLAVELRHKSWWVPETAQVLRDLNVCWVGADESPRHEVTVISTPDTDNTRSPRQLIPTTNSLYIRWLGKHGQFDDRSREHVDPSLRLRCWVERLNGIVKQHPQIRDIYGFFDNDFAGHAPASAKRLLNILKLPDPKPNAHNFDEPTLFG